MSYSNEHSWGEYYCYLCRTYIAVHEIGDWFVSFGYLDESDPSIGAKDKSYICRTCMPKYKENWKDRLEIDKKIGDLVKSRTEEEVAKSLNLRWVGQDGLGVHNNYSKDLTYLDPKNYREPYQWIPKEVYKKLKVLEQLLKYKVIK